MNKKIKVINYYLDDEAFAPVRAHSVDAGLDLRTRNMVTVKAHDSAIFNTGVHIDIPEGYAGFLKSKSGLNMKYGIIGTGLIDAGYTGPIIVKLYNLSDIDHTFSIGDKIIQLVISPVETPELVPVETFTSNVSNRGNNGFGSTGI